MAGRAYYAPDGPDAADVTPPRIARATAVLTGRSLALRAEVADGSGEVRLVTVLWTDPASPGSWNETPLLALGDGRYGADVVLAADATAVDFYVQALDSGGNVGVSSNKGANFRSVPAAPPTITRDGPA